jgi:hypothetical protein
MTICFFYFYEKLLYIYYNSSYSCDFISTYFWIYTGCWLGFRLVEYFWFGSEVWRFIWIAGRSIPSDFEMFVDENGTEGGAGIGSLYLWVKAISDSFNPPSSAYLFSYILAKLISSVFPSKAAFSSKTQ